MCVYEKERERERNRAREGNLRVTMQERAGENILVCMTDFLREFEGIGSGLGTDLSSVL